jgi:putative ABC transport system substrate-binding protein
MLGVGLIAAPPRADSQPPGRIHRVGFLWDTPAVWPHALEAFHQGLRDLGWVEGKNIVVEYRWAQGRFDRLADLVEELVRLNVDLIVAPTSIYTGAAMRKTSKIPIVFASHADPVGSGHVATLGRPGKNATGLTIVMSETMAKSLELLKDAVPGLARVAVIWDPSTPSHRPGLKAVEDTGKRLSLRIQPVAVRNAAEYESAFSSIVQERANGVLVLSTPLFMGGAKQLAELALTHKLPDNVRTARTRRGRRAPELQPRPCRPLPACRHLRRQNTEGRESERAARPASDQVRSGRQSENSKGPRVKYSADGTTKGGSSD